MLENPRHEHFAQAVAKGRSAKAAYADAYARRADSYCESAGSRLLRNDKVASRVAELQRRAVQRHDVSIYELTAELRHAIDTAKQQQRPGDIVSAAMALAKLHGLVVEKRETTNHNHTISAEAIPESADAWLKKHKPH